MVRRPKRCGPRTTVAQLAEFFADEHVHAALVMDDDTLLAVVERADLPGHAGGTPASTVGSLSGRTVRDTARVDEALALMRAAPRRRLAVLDAAGRCVGLLCLKRTGDGFCSDADVADRAAAHDHAR